MGIRGVLLLLMAAAIGLGADGCEPSGEGLLSIRSSRYFESRTDNPEADARYRVGQGTYPVELTAYDVDTPDPAARAAWNPSLWINFKGVGRSESISADGMTCRQGRAKIVTCIGTTHYETTRRGPSRISVRLRGRTILAMEIVELSPPAMEADSARYAPDAWPMVVASFRERDCRWGEPLRCPATF